MAKLDYSFYNSAVEGTYSDGSIELEIYDIVQSGKEISDVLENDSRWPILYHLSPLRHNILSWYSFKEDASVLEVGAGCGALTGLFCEKMRKVTSVELTELRSKINYERHKQYDNLTIYPGNFNGMVFDELFDYVILNGVLEYAPSFTDSEHPFETFLSFIFSKLKPDGKVLIAIENQFGAKYMTGAREDHSGQFFTGLNEYADFSVAKTLSKNQLIELLTGCGFSEYFFYYPFPDYKFPNQILTDESFKNIDFHYDTRPLDAARVNLYDELNFLNRMQKENRADYFANSFLVEASPSAFEVAEEKVYIKLSNQRKEKFQIQTSIVRKKEALENYSVSKQALSGESRAHLEEMHQNGLVPSKDSDFTYLESTFSKDTLSYPFIKGETFSTHLDRLLLSQKQDLFFQELLYYRNYLEKNTVFTDQYHTPAFKEWFGDEEIAGKFFCSTKVNIDLIFSNLIFSNDQWLIIDYEWVYPNQLPVEFVLYRAILTYYITSPVVQLKFDFDELLNSLHIPEKNCQVYEKWNSYFIDTYVGSDLLSKYYHPSLFVQFDASLPALNKITPRLYLPSKANPKNLKEKNISTKKIDRSFISYAQFTQPLEASSWRFDPAEQLVECTLEYCLVNGVNAKILSHNGIEKGENVFVFNTSDPMFYFDVPEGNIETIEVKFKATRLYENFTQLETAYVDLCEERNQFEKTNSKTEEKVLKLEETNSKTEEKVLQLEENIVNLNEEVSSNRAIIIEQQNRITAQENHIVDKEGQITAQESHIIDQEEQITAQESHIIDQEEQITAQKNRITAQKNRIGAQKNRITAQAGEETAQKSHIIAQEKHIIAQQNHIEAQEGYIEHLSLKYNQISNSTFWKITKPFRWLLDGLKKVLHKIVHVFKAIFKSIPGVKNLYEYFFISKYFGKENAKFNKKVYGNYTGPTSMLISPFVPSMDDLRKQYNESQNSTLKFSIITPLYNTPESLLREMILSVKNQSYPNWELCLADGGSDPNVQRIVEEFAKEDSRIRYKKLNENLGISGNSNAAIEMSTGDYIALLDHDDLLSPCALYENWKVIQETGAEFVYSDELTFEDDITNVTFLNYKSDFFIDTFLSFNYLCHFSTFSKKLLNQLDTGFQAEFDGSQDYDLFLRLLEKTDKIDHIPKILYFWRSHPGSVAKNIGEKNYAVDAAIHALEAHFERENIKADVGLAPRLHSTYRVQYKLTDRPLVSIIIPNKDEADTLLTCVNSILLKTTYENYEIIICENNSETEEIFEVYEQLKENPKVNIVTWENYFNYSSINNYAVSFAKGEQLIFLNNDTEVITVNWIEEMLMFSQRPDVGAVGAKLYYPDNTIQHAGVIFGMGGVAGHYGLNANRSDVGYVGNLKYSRDVTAVTAACLMMRKNVFDQIGGFDPAFAVAFNDVDLCLKIRSLGYLIVWTPYAELYHYESKTRGSDTAPDKIHRFHNEIYLFQDKWSQELRKGDPTYNPNLV